MWNKYPCCCFQHSCVLTRLQTTYPLTTFELVTQCDGGVLQDPLVGKILERIKGFLWFLKRVKGIEPALTYCVNPDIVQQFVEFMMKNRGVKAVTCMCTVCVVLNKCLQSATLMLT